MKDKDAEKLGRSHPVRSAELDRRLLERAEKLTEGKKTIGESREPVFSVLNVKEDNTMDKNTNITEVRSHKPAAFAAIAAVLVLAVGGAVYASKYNSSHIDTAVPAAHSETDSGSGNADGSPAEWAKEYLARNEDTFGYVSIPNIELPDGRRAIDFPVAASEDNRFYLTHAFDKTEDPNGCIFADYSAVDGSQPQIIQLFGSASFSDFSWDYDSEYWRIRPEAGADTEKPGFTALLFYNMSKAISQAPVIEFKTIWQDGGEYMIFGCTTVQGDALGIGKVDDIGEWVSGIRDLSDFDVDIDCGADDKYLVLDLCEGGRSAFRVFAKKLDADDDKEKIISSYREKESESRGNSAIEDRKLPFWIEQYVNGTQMLDASVGITEDHEISGIFPISMVGDKAKKTELFFTDPISSDSRTGRFCYALYDIDFFNKTITLNGEINKEAAERMLGEGAGAVMMKIPVSDGVTDSVNFDVLIDGVKCFNVPMALDGRAGHINFLGMAGTGKKIVTLRTQLDGKTVDYAVYDVDFANGGYTYIGGTSDLGASEKQKDSSGGSVMINLPYPEGFKHKITFEAYYEDNLMGTAVYNPDSLNPLEGIMLTEDGVEKIGIRAIIDDDTVINDFMVCIVDFDNGTYKYAEGGEPKTAEAFDMP